MPFGVVSGQAQVTISSGTQMITGNVVAGASGPGMFALNGIGMGEGAVLSM
jgi:hypothetical protein